MKKSCLLSRNATALAAAWLLGLGALMPSAAAAAGNTNELRGTWTLMHQAQSGKYEIATDQIYFRTADGRYQLQKIAPLTNAEAVRQYLVSLPASAAGESDLVLYRQGVPRTDYTRCYLTRDVLIRLASGTDAAALAAAAGVSAPIPVAYAPGYYFLKAARPAGALLLAETLRTQPGVLYSQPQMANQLQPHWVPNDPLFTNQWHLLNTGQNGATPGIDANVTNVWDVYHGSGVIIGIIDSGVQTNHPDLLTNLIPDSGHNWLGGDPNDPMPDMTVPDDFHGTAVSGVAAAVGNNTLGVSGAAPEANLVPERLIGGPTTASATAEAFLWKNNIISIKNNSWGYSTAFYIAGPTPLEEAALEQSVNNARNGRGMVFVFSAGNGRFEYDNANFGGYPNSIYCLSVGAINDRGDIDNYSTPGACLLISAPSGGDLLSTGYSQGTTTTDFTDTNGYNNVLDLLQGGLPDYSDMDYTMHMNGTSSSAPLVSGVIALILEANPNLGYRDVQEILARSARVLNPRTAGWVTNAAGFHFSDDYGAGMVDAQAAVALARTWQNLGPLTSTTSELNNLGLSIPDNTTNGVSANLVVSGANVRVEHATLTVDISHSRYGELEIILTSPSGVQSYLATPRPYDLGSDMQWTFMTTHDWGESSLGTWTVTVRDRVSGRTGTVNSLKLTLYGTGGGAPPPTDFADLAIRVSANPDPVLVGSNLVYSVTVTNKGNLPADDVSVTQNLPASVLFLNATVTNGTAVQIAGVLTWAIGPVAGHGSTTMMVRVIPVVPETIFTSASVTTSTPDADPSNNDFINSVRVRPLTTDLTLNLTDSPDPVLIGDTLTYSAAVTNRGPSLATGVTLTTTLPAGMLIKSVTLSQGTWSAAGNVITCNVGSLANAQRALASIAVTPLLAGNLVASARVTGKEYDPVPQNNYAVTTTAVNPAADLGLSLAVAPNPAVVNSNFTYYMVVTNRGPNAASAVVLNQTLPAGVTFVSATPSNAVTYSSGTVTANLGTLNVGSSAAVTVTARSSTAGLYSSTASASATQADQNPADNSATVSITVASPFVSIVPAGSTLTAESSTPANGAIEPNETVTVQLRLRNVGNVSNTNLVATLLQTNGVAYVAGGTYTNSYGVLPGAGLPVSSAFTFKALNTSNGQVVATLRLRDNGKDIGFASFPFTLPAVTPFANPAAITIPSVGTATPYPSLINVAGVTGVVGNVAVTLSNLSHTYPHDISILLVGPGGQKIMLMSHAGGTPASANPIVNSTVNFDATAATVLPAGDQIVSGSYQPAAYLPSVALPPPAPTNGYSTALSVFNGADANGTWSLFVLDDSAGDQGVIANGWSLQIKTIFPVNQAADLSLTVADAPDPVLAGSPLTYVFTALNAGPNAAANAVFTNVLPASLKLLSAKSSQGIVATNGNTVICNLGAIAPGGTATVTNVVIPRIAGLITNLATIYSSEVDLNPANNAAAAVTISQLPQADVATTLAASLTNAIVTSNLTYTITVTNLGPQNALNVLASNVLSAGVSFVSASGTNASCTNVGKVVFGDFGDLAPGAGGVMVITATITNAGNLTNTVTALTTSQDTNGLNQTATVVTSAVSPAPIIATAGSTLIGQNHVPPNGVINPGESVTMSFSLVNVGQVQTTTNFVARLLSTNGVTNPGTNQNYGVLAPDGPATARKFAFTASSNATTLVATLALTDGTNDLGTLSFPLEMPGAPTHFTSTAAITIPDHGTARPYPSGITVSGLAGLISKLTVTLNNLTHTFPSDVNVLLVSPAGQAIRLMSAASYGHSVTNVTLQFDDAADASLPQNAALQSGTFKPTNYGSMPFPYPTPAGPYSSLLADCNGFSPNGSWALYILDSSPGDAGSLSGWALDITTVSPLTPAANLAVTGVSTAATASVGDFVTNTFSVFNAGPDTAPGVLITNAIPSFTSLISAKVSQGAVTNSSGTLLGHLGSLASGASATLTVVLVPMTVQTFSSVAAAYAATTTDLNLANNVVTLTTSVQQGSPVVMLNGIFDAASQTFTLTLTGQPEKPYAVRTSSDLVTWVSLATITTDASGVAQFADGSSPGVPVRFYRAERAP